MNAELATCLGGNALDTGPLEASNNSYRVVLPDPGGTIGHRSRVLQLMTRLSGPLTSCGWLARRLVSLLMLVVLLAAAPFQAAFAAVAPSLGTAGSFAVLGGSTVTNTGPTILIGDLGVSPGTAITGFPPGTVVGGTIHAADAVAAQAQNATTTAYNALASQACNTTFGVPTDLVGMTLVPGVYCFSSSAALSGALTLDAQGDPNAVWVFKVGSTLITGSNASVVTINGGQQCNVFWQVGSSATIGTGTSFAGNILALTSITLTTNATLAGRALAQNGAVTLDSNVVSISTCAVPPVTPIPPTLGKSFSPATIAAGGTSTLTLTLSNADATAAVLTAPLVDTLPTGLVVAATPNAANTCGGTVTTSATSVTLTGGGIAANSSCTVTVNVTAADGGGYVNSLATGALQTSNGGNAAPAIATLTVIPALPSAPTLGKAFTPATIAQGGTSTLTVTLSNTNSTAAILTAPLVDTLPGGLTVSGIASTTCTGAVTTTTSTVTLATGSSIPANGSCTVTVNVNAAAAGNYTNSLAAGALQTSNGSNGAPAISTLTVTPLGPNAPTLGKAFSPATIPTGGVSTLTITFSNSNSSAATLSAPLVDTLPSGMLTSGPASTTCAGTATTTATSVTLAAGSKIPANSSCTVTVNVTAAAGGSYGSYINSLAAGALKTDKGNNAAPAVATLTVSTPSSIGLGKSFWPSTLAEGAVSTLTLTLSNSAGTPATLAAPLVDTLPNGMKVAGYGSNTCGGIVSAPVGGSRVTLTGGAIPAHGSCTVTVPVNAAAAGYYVNTLAAGALQTRNGNNPAAAMATLNVTAVHVAPTLKKAFSPASIREDGVSTLTLTLSNVGNKAPLIKPLVDNLPGGMRIAGYASTTCNGTVSASIGGPKLSLTGGAIPANGSCKVTVNVTARQKGSYVNKLAPGALQTANGSNAAGATATLTVSK
jgi:hypothetical protein